MASVLFTIYLSAMLFTAFHGIDTGVNIQFRTNGNIFNLQRLRAQTRIKHQVLRDLLFAHDCALIPHAVEDMRLNEPLCIRFQVIWSLTELMYQPAPDEPSEDPVITIDDNHLKCV